jgi:Transglutaminase-like superfamily
MLLVIGCDSSEPNRSLEVESNGLLPERKREPKSEVTPVAPEKPKTLALSAGSIEGNWIQRSELPIERWYACYNGGKCIGVSKLLIEPAESQVNVVLITQTAILEYVKDGKALRRKIELKSTENLDGTFSSFTATDTIGENQSKTNAELRAGVLSINTKPSNGDAKATSMAWVPGAWGPLGTLALLRLANSGRNHVEGQIFIRELEKFAKTELKFHEPELTTLLGGDVRELALVEITIQSAATPTKNWIDKAGFIVKSVTPDGFRLFETDQQNAMRIDAEVQLATMLDRSVEVSVTSNALKQSTLTYQIDGLQSDPFFKFSQLVNQRVKSSSSRSADVTVFRISNVKSETLQQDKPTDACLVVMDSESKHVEKWANEIAGQTSSVDQTVRMLTEGVHRQLKRESLSRRFDAAPEVVVRQSGDCKGHAVLLMALLRSRSVPARVASGLLVKESNGKAAASFHMWNEAYVDGRWIPIDAYQNEFGVGVDHIKMFHSTLDKDQNPYDAVLPVLDLIPQLHIVAK